MLGSNDYVGVEVFGEDDLRTNGRLNPEGNLSVPLLGSVHLAGLTLTQAASKLTELYSRDYLVNPKSKRHASWLREAALFNLGTGGPARQLSKCPSPVRTVSIYWKRSRWQADIHGSLRRNE